MLKLNDELVLFGFEAEGYYTGNFEENKCLVRKKDFDAISKNINIPEDLDIYEFDELNGKHAHVEGDYVEETMTVDQFIKSSKNIPHQWLVEDTFPAKYIENTITNIFSVKYRKELEKEINELKQSTMIDLTVTIPADKKKDKLMKYIETLK